MIVCISGCCISSVCRLSDAAGKPIPAEPATPPQAGDEEQRRYEDFDPLLTQQNANRPHLHFDTFDGALDEFFSKVCPSERCLQCWFMIDAASRLL